LVCAQVKAPVAPAVAFSALACAIDESVPPVDSRSARAVSAPGLVHVCDVTARSGELTTTSTTHAPLSVVVICACVSSPEAFCSPTIVAAVSGSPLEMQPRYCVTIAAQLSVRPLPVIVCPV
jgi:hypothetical protein